MTATFVVLCIIAVWVRLINASAAGAETVADEQHDHDVWDKEWASFYQERHKFDAGIETLRESFANGEFAESPELWAQIGLAYKDLDARWNDGGDVKALDAFDRAINLTDENEYPLIFAAHLQRALLLIDLGKGLEALRALDLASVALTTMAGSQTCSDTLHGKIQADLQADISASGNEPTEANFDYDQATLLRYAGDVFMTILKDSRSASRRYLQSIELYPCAFPVYLKYVNALLDTDDSSPELWQRVFSLLENAVAKYLVTGNEKHEVCAEYEERSYTSKFNVRISSQAKNGHADNSTDEVGEHTEGDASAASALYWTLAAVSNKLQQYDLAWYYLSQAHAQDEHLLLSSQAYSLDTRREAVESLLANQRTDFWPTAYQVQQYDIGSRSTVPIFVVGFFRSGSTLLETMLDSHPQIWGMGEESVLATELPEFRRQLLASVRKRPERQPYPDSVSDKFDVISGGAVVNKFADRILRRMMTRYHRAKTAAVEELEAIRNEAYEDMISSDDLEKQRQRLEIMAGKQDGGITADLFLNTSSKFSSQSNKTSVQFRIVDKMLNNYMNIGFIRLMFPNAIVLHTVRDPLDTLASCYKLKFASPAAVFTLDMHTLVQEYLLYQRIIQHFRGIFHDQSKDGDAESMQRPGFEIIDVPYELLVTNPEQVMRALLYKLRLPWDDRVLNHTHTYRTVRTASMMQIRRSLYNNSIGSWRKFAAYLRGPSKEGLQLELQKMKDILPVITNASVSTIRAADVSSVISLKRDLSYTTHATTVSMNWDLDENFNYSSYIEQLTELTPITSHDILRTLCLDHPECVNKHAPQPAEGRLPTTPFSVESFLQLNPNAELLYKQSQHLVQLSNSQVQVLLGLFERIFVFLDCSFLHCQATARETHSFDVSVSVLRVALLLQRGRLLSRVYGQVSAVLDFNEALRLLGQQPHFHVSISDEHSGDTNNATAAAEMFILKPASWLRSARCYHDDDSGDAATHPPDEMVNAEKREVENIYCKAVISRKLSGVALLLYYRAEALYSMPATDFAYIVHALEPAKGPVGNGPLSSLLALKFSSLGYKEALLVEPFDISMYFGYLTSLQSLGAQVFTTSQLRSIVTYALEVVDLFGKEALTSTLADRFIEAPREAVGVELEDNIAERMAQHTSGIYWGIFGIAERCLKDYKLAWKALEIAHTLDSHRLRKSKHYSLQTNVIRATETIRTQTHKSGFWPAPAQNIGSHSKLCVFVVGFYRSGSSLLETMLRRHPKIDSLGETSLAVKYVSVLEQKIQAIVRQSKQSQQQALHFDAVTELRDFVGQMSSRIISKTKKAVLDNLKYSHDTKYSQAQPSGSGYTDELLNSNTELPISSRNGFREDRDSVRGRPAGEAPNAHSQVTRVLDKMLANYLHLGYIRMLFPSAIIIHTMRDPMDTILSVYKHRFGSEQLVMSLTWDTLIAEYVTYLSVMQHFREQFANFDGQHGGLVEVSYEALVANPEMTLRAVLYKLGLDWDPAVLNHTTVQRTVYTASMMQVRESLYTRSIGSWRKYAPYLSEVTASFKEKLKPLKSNLPKVATGFSILSSRQSSSVKVPAVSMNWKLDPKFDYNGMIRTLHFLNATKSRS
jgi:hypothetical protein